MKRKAVNTEDKATYPTGQYLERVPTLEKQGCYEWQNYNDEEGERGRSCRSGHRCICNNYDAELKECSSDRILSEGFSHDVVYEDAWELENHLEFEIICAFPKSKIESKKGEKDITERMLEEFGHNLINRSGKDSEPSTISTTNIVASHSSTAEQKAAEERLLYKKINCLRLEVDGSIVEDILKSLNKVLNK